MIYLLNSLPNQSVRHYDVCVVGTGPAGMTLALEYIRSSSHTSRVAVLESGYPGCGELYRQGFDFACKATIQTIYQGEVNGWIQRSRPHYLVNSRLRYLGGTSNVWGGWCWPLERFDIEERPTRPGAVWPVTYDELLPYYERAQRICELGTIAYDSLEYWIQLCQLQMLSPMALDETELRTRIVQFHALNFWERYKSLLASSPSVDVYCNANLIRLINEPEEP